MKNKFSNSSSGLSGIVYREDINVDAKCIEVKEKAKLIAEDSNITYIDNASSKPWSSQFWTQLKQLRTEAWKSQDFNGVWTRDLAIPVRRSNQLSYEARYAKYLMCFAEVLGR